MLSLARFSMPSLVWAAIREWVIMSGRLKSSKYCARTRENFSISTLKPRVEKVLKNVERAKQMKNVFLLKKP